jgi:hypothetical protein
MSDRELLEFAAKAAGYGFIRWETDEDGVGLAVVNHGYWQPLYMNTSTSCDGDALRLMVRLRLHARQFPVLDDGFDAPLGMVEVWRVDDDDPMHVEYFKRGDDRLIITRRAIVRAAAEIGRQMP